MKKIIGSKVVENILFYSVLLMIIAMPAMIITVVIEFLRRV
ncbi:MULTISPECIES: hypothetical protein [Bacillaceae]|nr:hypothetical protein [Cytobacillus oceanisediminis]